MKNLKAEGKEIIYIKFKMDNKVRTGIMLDMRKEGSYRVWSRGQIRIVETGEIIVD